MGEVQRKVRVELGPDSYEIIIGRNLKNFSFLRIISIENVHT